MADRSMGSSSAGGRDMLPLVFCPKCKLQVITGIADNARNRGKAYYMCPNYNGVWNCCCLLCVREAEHASYWSHRADHDAFCCEIFPVREGAIVVVLCRSWWNDIMLQVLWIEQCNELNWIISSKCLYGMPWIKLNTILQASQMREHPLQVQITSMTVVEIKHPLHAQITMEVCSPSQVET